MCLVCVRTLRRRRAPRRNIAPKRGVCQALCTAFVRAGTSASELIARHMINVKLRAAQAHARYLDGGLPLFLQSAVSLGVDFEVLRLGVRSQCKWAAAGQIFPASPVSQRHSALAQALWISTPVQSNQRAQTLLGACRSLVLADHFTHTEHAEPSFSRLRGASMALAIDFKGHILSLVPSQSGFKPQSARAKRG